GLNENLKLEMMKSKRTSVDEIYQSISLVEDILIQKLKSIYHADKRDTMNQMGKKADPFYKKTSRTDVSKKYCKYHKSKTSNTNECISLAKIKNKKATRKDEKLDEKPERGKNFGITSAKNTRTILEIPIRCFGKQSECYGRHRSRQELYFL
ncbi:hypothetical protein EQH57_0187, partial [Dictyocoela roeselum]